MPARGTVLLRKPETEDSIPGGKIILTQDTREGMAANQMQIVSVGEPEICQWPEDCSEFAHTFLSLREVVHPIDPRIIPGAWVIIRPRSLVELPDGQYLVRQSEVYGVFRDSEAEAIREITSANSACTSEPIRLD